MKFTSFRNAFFLESLMRTGVVTIASAFLFNIFLSVATSFAQSDDLRPCGTFTKSTRLTSDCVAPLTVGASKVTVDLGGHTIVSPPLSRDVPSIQIIRVSGVVVQNGTVRASGGGPAIVIRGGNSNTINLIRAFVTQGGDTVTITEGSRNKVTNSSFFVDYLSSGITMRGEKNQFVDSSLYADFNDVKTFIRLDGSGNALLGNQIRCRNGLILVSGSSALVESNSLHLRLTEQPTPISAITVTGRKALLQNNDIVFEGSIEGADMPVRIASSNNRFENNLLLTNTITGITIDGANKNSIRNNKQVQSITAKGSGNTIANNFANNITIDGTKNNISENFGRFFTDTTPGCGSNVWRNNLFFTDSEGDGNFAGCIQ